MTENTPQTGTDMNVGSTLPADVEDPKDVYLHCCARCGRSFEEELQKAREQERERILKLLSEDKFTTTEDKELEDILSVQTKLGSWYEGYRYAFISMKKKLLTQEQEAA